MAKPQQSAQAKPADTRCDIAINDVAINGLTPATKTIQAFALAIAQMSRRALDRTTQHIEALRKTHTVEEVTSIQMEFVKDSLEHAAQHTKKLCEMLTALPLDMAKPYQQHDWLQLVTAAVQTTEAAGRAAAAKRLYEVPRRN
ncbi:MAG: phasin family protein [Methylocella sp.]